MELSNNIKTDIEINKAIAQLYKRHAINIEGANAAIDSVPLIAKDASPEKLKRHLASIEVAIRTDQRAFMSGIESLTAKYGKDRVSRIMRTGIDLSEHTTH